MAIKKKKTEKKADLLSRKNHPAQKKGLKASNPGPESSRPLLGGIGRSVGNLLDRTKAYLGSGKKAEA
jgi:hypothetical protein